MGVMRALKLGGGLAGGLFVGLVLLGHALGPSKSREPSTPSYITPQAKYLNNYRAGSYTHNLVAPAARLFPNLSIVLMDNRSSSTDLVSSNTSQDLTQAYPIIQRYGKQKLRDMGYRVNAMTVAEEVFAKSNTCPVFATQHLDSMPFVLRQGVVLHESIHCARFQLMQYNRELLKAQLRVLFARVQGGMSLSEMREFMRAMDEGMVTAMLRSLSFAQGEIGRVAAAQFDREYQTAMRGEYTNETPAVAKLMPEICAKQGDCPTEISALMTKLFADKRYIQAMASDIKWLNQNAERWGMQAAEG